MTIEDELQPLTDEEKEKVLPMLKKWLFNRHEAGKTEEVSNTYVRSVLQKHKGIKISASRIRKIFYHITCQGLIEGRYVLCANTKGYYLTDDKEVVLMCIESLKERLSKQSHKVKKLELLYKLL